MIPSIRDVIAPRMRLALPTILLYLLLTACASAVDSSIGKTSDATTSDLGRSFRTAVTDVIEKDLDASTTARLLEAELLTFRGTLEPAIAIYSALSQQFSDPDLAKRYAEIAAASEDIHVLLDAALLWYELAPEDTVAQELAIRALARMGEVEGAWEIIAKSPENHMPVRVLAAEIRRAQFGPQMEWLTEAITANYGARPNSSELLLALSLLSSGLSLTDAAESYAAGALAIEQTSLLAAQLQANALLQLERRDEAVTVIADYALRSAASEDDRVQAASILASLDRPKALSVFQQLTAEFPENKDLTLSTGQLLLADNQVDEAERLFLMLTDAKQYQDTASFNLGRIYESRAENEQAIDYYQQVDEGDFEFEARLRTALLTVSSDPAKIDGYFDKLLNDFPEQSVVIYFEQGRALEGAGYHEKAVEVLTAGLQEAPNNASLLYARSINYESLDKVDEAVADLRAVLATDTENASAQNALGYTLANRTDNYQEAYVLIEKALKQRPDDPAIIDSMGWVLYKLGRYDESLQYLLRAHEALFDEEIVSHLVQVLYALNRVEEAKAVMRESLDKLPESEELRELETRLILPSS